MNHWRLRSIHRIIRLHRRHTMRLSRAWRLRRRAAIRGISGEGSPAYRDYVRRTRDAWRPDPTEIALHDAASAYKQTADIAPVLAALPPSQALRHFVLYLHEQAHPLGKKTPRPGRANYVAADQAEFRLDAWRSEHRKKNVPYEIRQKIVDEVIEDMRGWYATRHGLWPDRPNRDRILELLRLAKDRRL